MEISKTDKEKNEKEVLELKEIFSLKEVVKSILTS